MLGVTQLVGFGGAFLSADVVDVADQYLPNLTTFGGTAYVAYELRSSGDAYSYFGFGPGADVGDYVVPKSNAGLYEARLALNFGTAPSGSPLGAWLALTTSWSWYLQRTAVGADYADCTIEIRRASDLVVMDSASIIFDIAVEF